MLCTCEVCLGDAASSGEGGTFKAASPPVSLICIRWFNRNTCLTCSNPSFYSIVHSSYRSMLVLYSTHMFIFTQMDGKCKKKFARLNDKTIDREKFIIKFPLIFVKSTLDCTVFSLQGCFFFLSLTPKVGASCHRCFKISEFYAFKKKLYICFFI